MTDLDRVLTVLTDRPQTIPQIAQRLGGMRAEDIDAALLELHRRSDADFLIPDESDFYALPAWKRARVTA